MEQQRIRTGVPGLDEVLMGGLVPQRTYLLVGRAGAGKTILSIQWLLEGQRQQERTLFLTLTEAGEEIRHNMASLGWSLDGVEIVDLTPAVEETHGEEYQVFTPSEVEQDGLWSGIYDAIRQYRPQRLVIDSVTQLRYLSVSDYQFRRKILSLVRFLNQSGCTTLLVFETSELERETAVALAVDGLIRLRKDLSTTRMIDLRSLQIDKLRGSDFMSGLHPMRITGDGIQVFPHRIEPIGAPRLGDDWLRTGNPPLDALVGGGIEMGTSTIISGPSGTGKTTLGLTFVLAGIAKGHRGVVFSFEEALESVLVRARGMGMALEPLLDAGTLRFLRLNPMEQHPDEFLGLVRRAVEEDGFDMVMVDSLRGYQLEMEQFGTVQSHIHNLLHYLGRKGVTSFLTNELDHITGDVRTTELAVSHLADNILLLRYVEHAGEMMRVVVCLKKRLSRTEPDLRKLEITSAGIRIGEKMVNLRGVLNGVAELVKDE